MDQCCCVFEYERAQSVRVQYVESVHRVLGFGWTSIRGDLRGGLGQT